MSGPLWQGPGDRVDTLPALPRQRDAASRPDPAADPLDELALRLHDVIAAAVHPDEIAAILESDGMTDDRIRLGYGRPDSFTLAAELYEKVPRSHPEPPPPPAEPWHTGLLGSLLRGLLFALPGLGWLLAAPLLGEPALPPLLAGALTGWVWNQAMAHRAYVRLGLGNRPAAARCLAAGAPAGALLSTVATLLCTGPGQGPSAVFSSAQAVYLGAATALLVLGHERALLPCLLPLPAGTAALLVTDLPLRLRLVLLASSLAATLLTAARHLHRTATAEPPAPGAGGGPRLAASLPHGLFGLGAGVLVLHAALGEVFAGVPGAVVAGPTAVALTLGNGPAEWLLLRFRGGALAGLRSATTPAAFRRAAVLVLARCLTAHLAVLGALACAATLLWPGAPGLVGVRLATLLLVGTVLWTGLLLQAFGSVTPAAAVVCAAAAAQTTLAEAGAGTPAATGLAVGAASAAALLLLVCVRLGRATAHRP